MKFPVRCEIFRWEKTITVTRGSQKRYLKFQNSNPDEKKEKFKLAMSRNILYGSESDNVIEMS